MAGQYNRDDIQSETTAMKSGPARPLWGTVYDKHLAELPEGERVAFITQFDADLGRLMTAESGEVCLKRFASGKIVVQTHNIVGTAATARSPSQH